MLPGEPVPVSSVDADGIRRRFAQIQKQIGDAATAAGREPGSVRLVTVTKGHPAEAVRAVAEAGATQLGENYTDEGLAKMAALAGLPLTWHMIGHVQSRKADEAARFDWLHSLDSLKLAQRLERFAGQNGRVIPVLLECNVSGEASKFGFAAGDRSLWPALAQTAAQIAELPHLRLCGLMTMAPYLDDPDGARPYFRLLRNLRDELAARVPAAEWTELSMGMSGDFIPAIQEGATLVRIGSAILGPRQRP